MDYSTTERASSTVISVVALILIVAAGIGGWWLGTSQPAYKLPSQNNTNQQKVASLNADMNKLWEDHITWTRLYILAAVNNLPDKDQNLARLLKNQEDLGNVIKPYYGNEAGNRLTTLLKDHIAGAGKVVEAVIKKDAVALASANLSWYDNANQIADFLAQANSNWPQDDMRAMMKDHLDLTEQEAVDILAKRSEASVADYDKIHNQILQMSQMLSAGVVKQYPDKF